MSGSWFEGSVCTFFKTYLSTNRSYQWVDSRIGVILELPPSWTGHDNQN